MSYILDALKKSEEERHQGEVPSLGGSSTLIHSSGNKPVIWPWVIAALLLLNMLFITYWLMSADAGNSQNAEMSDRASYNYEEDSPAPFEHVAEPLVTHQKNKIRVDPVVYPDTKKLHSDEKIITPKVEALEYNLPQPESSTPSTAFVEPSVQAQNTLVNEEPMLITPKSGARAYSGPAYNDINEEVTIEEPDVSSVKHISDFPHAFQRRIPDMSFNSHIFTDLPSSRRVMINNIYLKEGQAFSGLTVVQITGEGIVLSLDGESFKVGVLRDWYSPK